MTERSLVTLMYALELWMKTPLTRDQRDRAELARKEAFSAIAAIEAERMGFDGSMKPPSQFE